LGNVLLAAVLGIAALAAVAVLDGHYQVRPVLSGSMEPLLPVGGVVVTERVPISNLRVGDVVVFHRPDRPAELVVHRIVALMPGMAGPVVRTKGDANATSDPWQVTLRGTTAYRASFSVPVVGYVAVWVHGPTGRETLLVVGLLLIAGVGVGSLARYTRLPGLSSNPRRPNV
jgi:signal peptidase